MKYLSLTILSMIVLSGCTTTFIDKVPKKEPTPFVQTPQDVAIPYENNAKISPLVKVENNQSIVNNTRSNDVKEAILIKDKPGIALSPYVPDAEINVEGLLPGTMFKDPFSGKLLKIPTERSTRDLSTIKADKNAKDTTNAPSISSENPTSVPAPKDPKDLKPSPLPAPSATSAPANTQGASPQKAIDDAKAKAAKNVPIL